MSKELSKVVNAVAFASTSKASLLTNDRVIALKGGHGMVNISVYAVANTIIEEVANGRALNVSFANKVRQPIDDVIDKCISAAKAAGADGANAALITASLLYLSGTAAQVGIPAGNRKLGATCRMRAGVDRAGVWSVNTYLDNLKSNVFSE